MGNGRGGGAGACQNTTNQPKARSDWGPLPLGKLLVLLRPFLLFSALVMPCLLYVVRQALAQLFFFRVSFAFLLSFFLSSFLSFVLSFFLSLLGAQLSSGLSFFGLFREPRPGPGRPRVCVGDASCVSSSPDFPARLRFVALFFLLSFLAPFRVSFLLCLFLFFALRLPRRRAGWLRSRQDSFCRGPSLGLFLFIKALFLRLFFGPLPDRPGQNR